LDLESVVPPLAKSDAAEAAKVCSANPPINNKVMALIAMVAERSDGLYDMTRLHEKMVKESIYRLN